MLEALTIKPPVQPLDARRHWRVCLAWALAGLAADQAIKAFVGSSLSLGEQVRVPRG